MISGIYIILNTINNKWYVGSGKDLGLWYKGRWYYHKQKLNTNRHFNQHLQSAWNKYGETCFEFHIVELIIRMPMESNENFGERLTCAEQKYINWGFDCNPIVMYNISKTANHPTASGWKMSDMAKQKIGDANRGRIRTEETKK